MFDPTYDPPIYTQRELNAAVVEASRMATRLTLQRIAELPLEVHGRWQPDTVYGPHALVLHDGHQWISRAQTSGEPGKSDAWRLLDTPINTALGEGR